MRLWWLALAVGGLMTPIAAAAAEQSSPAGEHVTGVLRPAPHGDIRHFDLSYWRSGRRWHGDHQGRRGWWWIVGPAWYWYPAAISLYPDPFTPPGLPPGAYYWCPDYEQYYPFVDDCPSPWQPTAP
jgi:hypothetical protein